MWSRTRPIARWRFVLDGSTPSIARGALEDLITPRSQPPGFPSTSRTRTKWCARRSCYRTSKSLIMPYTCPNPGSRLNGACLLAAVRYFTQHDVSAENRRVGGSRAPVDYVAPAVWAEFRRDSAWPVAHRRETHSPSAPVSLIPPRCLCVMSLAGSPSARREPSAASPTLPLPRRRHRVA
jgi:hypothetical protein